MRVAIHFDPKNVRFRSANQLWYTVFLIQLGYALEMAQAAFGIEAIPEERERLALSPLRRAWLMAHINPVSLLTHSNRRLTTIPWRSHTLQIGLIDRPADLGRLLLHSLWPEDGWLEKRYGERGWAVRLRHTTAALRGRF